MERRRMKGGNDAKRRKGRGKVKSFQMEGEEEEEENGEIPHRGGEITTADYKGF